MLWINTTWYPLFAQASSSTSSSEQVRLTSEQVRLTSEQIRLTSEQVRLTSVFSCIITSSFNPFQVSILLWEKTVLSCIVQENYFLHSFSCVPSNIQPLVFFSTFDLSICFLKVVLQFIHCLLFFSLFQCCQLHFFSSFFIYHVSQFWHYLSCNSLYSFKFQHIYFFLVRGPCYFCIFQF